MLDSYESAFARQVEKEIAALADARVNQIIDGAARSFEEYRERVGYLRALGDMRTVMTDVRDRLNGKSEER